MVASIVYCSYLLLVGTTELHRGEVGRMESCSNGAAGIIGNIDRCGLVSKEIYPLLFGMGTGVVVVVVKKHYPKVVAFASRLGALRGALSPYRSRY